MCECIQRNIHIIIKIIYVLGAISHIFPPLLLSHFAYFINKKEKEKKLRRMEKLCEFDIFLQHFPLLFSINNLHTHNS